MHSHVTISLLEESYSNLRVVHLAVLPFCALGCWSLLSYRLQRWHSQWLVCSYLYHTVFNLTTSSVAAEASNVQEVVATAAFPETNAFNRESFLYS